MQRVHILVSGLVQGVFFRQNTRDLAQKLGVSGWVKNTPDGKVEIVAEGDREKLEELVLWCHKGPPFAHVDDISLEWEKPTGEFKNFEVLP